MQNSDSEQALEMARLLEEAMQQHRQIIRWFLAYGWKHQTAALFGGKLPPKTGW